MILDNVTIWIKLNYFWFPYFPNSPNYFLVLALISLNLTFTKQLFFFSSLKYFNSTLRVSVKVNKFFPNNLWRFLHWKDRKVLLVILYDCIIHYISGIINYFGNLSPIVRELVPFKDITRWYKKLSSVFQFSSLKVHVEGSFLYILTGLESFVTYVVHGSTYGFACINIVTPQ